MRCKTNTFWHSSNTKSAVHIGKTALLKKTNYLNISNFWVDSQPVPLGYDWLTALQAFTADQPIGLRRQLKPENRPAFVEQLLRGIRRQERNKPGESYQARQNFQEVVSGLLAEWHEDEPPTDNWFLGVALERLLQESEKR